LGEPKAQFEYINVQNCNGLQEFFASATTSTKSDKFGAGQMPLSKRDFDAATGRRDASIDAVKVAEVRRRIDRRNLTKKEFY